ncbi:MAG: hypothetical protein HKP48_02830 [Winogradskyella sp.]|uniref:hypothetical protein n=1 Tax=Winogradskyella sp. TaxID=1883156 RepID=UPI0017A7A901|nr:hypothetical protein [Winogradskyella sp.]MBT8246035.1 hypothetical protein [Winogradskyella sp.]NNK22244.1 hypothetical protein [Winogradskyella sp.]
MKKLILLFLLGTLLACDLDNGNEVNFSLEIMSIESVDIPTEFNFGQTHEITLNYTRPNGCYQFNDFIFQPDGNTRTVAVVDAIFNDANCTQATVEASVSFNFSVISSDTYTFQFYQGTSDTGEDQYLIIEVPVVQ